MSLITLLGTLWTVWKFAAKRFGPVGGFVVAVVFVASYAYLEPWLTERVPALERIVE